MIRVIFGWYNTSNPLFGYNNGQIVNATDIKDEEAALFVRNLVELSQREGKTENYNFYVGKNKKVVDTLRNHVLGEGYTSDDILLVYDNGNKFWGVPYDRVDDYLKAMKEDEELELI